jgi:hypothetical protein
MVSQYLNERTNERTRLQDSLYAKPCGAMGCVCYCISSHVTDITLHTKVKVKLSLCLTKYHAMKAYWGSGRIAPPFITSVLDGGEWSASCNGRFTPGERAPGTDWGPKASLVVVARRKTPSPCRG